MIQRRELCFCHNDYKTNESMSEIIDRLKTEPLKCQTGKKDDSQYFVKDINGVLALSIRNQLQPVVMAHVSSQWQNIQYHPPAKTGIIDDFRGACAVKGNVQVAGRTSSVSTTEMLSTHDVTLRNVDGSLFHVQI